MVAHAQDPTLFAVVKNSRTRKNLNFDSIAVEVTEGSREGLQATLLPLDQVSSRVHSLSLLLTTHNQIFIYATIIFPISRVTHFPLSFSLLPCFALFFFFLCSSRHNIHLLSAKHAVHHNVLLLIAYAAAIARHDGLFRP